VCCNWLCAPDLDGLEAVGYGYGSACCYAASDERPERGRHVLRFATAPSWTRMRREEGEEIGRFGSESNPTV